jgi:LPS-assembly protein
MDMPSSTSLDQRFSDIVGESSIKLNNYTNLKYDFSIDQGYKDINYSEIGADISVNKNTKFNISYLEEKNHIGQNEYIKSDINFEIGEFNSLAFSTKRNLLTNSAEFYNLSYDYINDCLKAGIVFRREFYSDRDIEPENSLMFRISIVPFANINSPKVSR